MHDGIHSVATALSDSCRAARRDSFARQRDVARRGRAIDRPAMNQNESNFKTFRFIDSRCMFHSMEEGAGRQENAEQATDHAPSTIGQRTQTRLATRLSSSKSSTAAKRFGRYAAEGVKRSPGINEIAAQRHYRLAVPA